MSILCSVVVVVAGCFVREPRGDGGISSGVSSNAGRRN